MEIRAQQPPALGGAEGDGAADRAFRDIQRLRRAVLQHGNRIANRRQPQSRQRRVFGHVDHVVYSAGLEAAGEVDGGRILDDAVPVLSGELPFLPGNGVPLPAHPVTYREHVAGIRRVSHRIGDMATVPSEFEYTFSQSDVASHQALDSHTRSSLPAGRPSRPSSRRRIVLQPTHERVNPSSRRKPSP